MAKKNSTGAAQTTAESIWGVASTLENTKFFMETYHSLINEQTDWSIHDAEESEDAQNAIIVLMRAMEQQFARISGAADKLREIARAGAN